VVCLAAVKLVDSSRFGGAGSQTSISCCGSGAGRAEQNATI